MNRLLSVLFIGLIASIDMLLPGSLWAHTVYGRVLDEGREAVPGVNVAVPALRRGTVTDEAGRFSFRGLPEGVHFMKFTAVGYAAETRTLTVPGDVDSLAITMRISPIELPALTVTAKPQPTDVLTSPLSVSIVEGRRLSRRRGQSIVQSIAGEPGVSTYTTGPGIVKPVIRGLTSQRVLVVTDGIRQEGQQWGDEHGPEIDALDVDRIEVVRGPNSVLYGSDALGGVINVIKADVPSASAGAPKIGGNLLLNGFSNNRQIAGAASIHGAGQGVGYRAHLSLRDAGDLRTPEGKLSNSGASELNGSGLIGTSGEWGSLSVDYARFGEDVQIHEDPSEEPGATPYQRILHQRGHLHAGFALPKLRLELNGSFQRNDRKEFEEANAGEPELYLVLDTATLDVKGHHAPVGSLFGTAGISLTRQTNRTLAEKHLIPPFDLLNVAGFLYEELALRAVTMSAGLRFDSRSLDVQNDADLGVDAQTRDYRAFTGTAGLVWRPAGPLAFALNIGRGWRAPTAFELFVDGVHEGTVRYEVGDAGLEPEFSLNVDFAVRYATERTRAEASVYRNRIDRYIFLSPTGEEDIESGFAKYQHLQADATLVGTELSVETQLADWLILSGGVDVVRGTNEQTDRPLPLIPAGRLKLGIRITRPAIGRLWRPYALLGATVAGSQDRVDVYETPSTGYTLLDLGVGGEFSIGAQRVSLDLAVENLTNKAYRNHLSRYKDYALNPGRNITLKAGIPFTLMR